MKGRRFEAVNLSAPPTQILSGDSMSVPQDRLEFIQPVNLWTLYYYQHDNALTINSHTYPVADGTIAIIPPGARVTHARVGGDTKLAFLCLDMPGKGPDKGVVPHVVPDMQQTYLEWCKCGERMIDTLVHLKAFAWNFMCLRSENTALYRADHFLYDAEAWILANIGSRFSVLDLCSELNMSPRRLLRAFREEHGLTVQEFIIRRRIREACRLLVTTELQPKVVAKMVGIHDLQHFNKLMRIHTGASPRRFRDAYEAHEVRLR